MAANGSLVYVPGVAGAAASRPSCRWIARDVPHRCLASRWTRTATSGCRPMARGSRWPPRTMCWIYDFARATLSRLTTDPARGHAARSGRPTGSASSLRRIRAGYPELFWRPADGTGSDERLLTRAKDLLDLRANGWSADGRQLLFTEVSPSDRQCAIGQIAIERPSDAKVLVKSEFCNDFAAVSPDGRWMAYELERVRSIGDLRRAVSGARKSATDLDGRRPSPTLVA